MKTEDSKELMNVKEVTEYLRLSRATLYRLLEKKEIPCYKVGRGIRFKREEVREYLKKQQKK
jgi:excisionase family DNA binding protein